MSIFLLIKWCVEFGNRVEVDYREIYLCFIEQKRFETESMEKKKCSHQFIGVMTIDGSLWCKWCDKWIKVIKPEYDPDRRLK